VKAAPDGNRCLFVFYLQVGRLILLEASVPVERANGISIEMRCQLIDWPLAAALTDCSNCSRINLF
jgi:hypothetical protein